MVSLICKGEGQKIIPAYAYSEDLSTALFARCASKTEEAAPQAPQKKATAACRPHRSRADLAPPGPTLSLTKQALQRTP